MARGRGRLGRAEPAAGRGRDGEGDRRDPVARSRASCDSLHAAVGSSGAGGVAAGDVRCRRRGGARPDLDRTALRLARRPRCASSRRSWGSTSRRSQGSGPGGRITADDVRVAASATPAMRADDRSTPARRARASRRTSSGRRRSRRSRRSARWTARRSSRSGASSAVSPLPVVVAALCRTIVAIRR